LWGESKLSVQAAGKYKDALTGMVVEVTNNEIKLQSLFGQTGLPFAVLEKI
jgi:hypothetical protein